MLKFTSIIFFIIICGGCSSPQINGIVTIPVNMGKVISYNLEENAEIIISLDTVSEALLANINSINFVHDTLVVFARNAVILFDIKGKHLCNLTTKGRGPDEFGDITHVFCKNGGIFISDMMNDCIRKYNTSGKLLQTFRLNEFDNGVIGGYPYPLNKWYVSRNQFRGTMNVTPELSLLDSNFNVVKASDRLKLNSGLIYYNYFASDENGDILYTQLLNDTIYSIDSNLEITPMYCVDFGKYKIPEEARRVYPDIYDLIEYTNANKQSIAALTSHICNMPQKLSCLLASNSKLYTLVYDKKKLSSQVYNIMYKKNYLFQPFQARYKDYHVMAAINSEVSEQNFTLFFFKL